MGKYGISNIWLEKALYDFERYMTAGRWDGCYDGGIYEDVGMAAVGCFVEFIETGKVTDENGEEL